MSAPITETPTVDSNRPMPAPMKPLRVEPSESAEIRVRPKIASQKYSTGPNFSAIWANSGARLSSASAPTSPPITEDSVDSVTARSPSPRWAMG